MDLYLDRPPKPVSAMTDAELEAWCEKVADSFACQATGIVGWSRNGDSAEDSRVPPSESGT